MAHVGLGLLNLGCQGWQPTVYKHDLPNFKKTSLSVDPFGIHKAYTHPTYTEPPFTTEIPV